MFGLLKNAFINLISKPATRNYPEVVRQPPAGVRGHLEIDIDVCIFCMRCSRECPCGALTVKRDPKSWSLEPGRCIICGYCVEVCPKKCLRLEPRHGLTAGCVNTKEEK